MSVKVMSWVWEHSRSKGTERLVLLAIADCAAEDGSNAYPSMAELCRKTGGLTDRGIQGAIARLVELGELKVYRNTGPRGVNRYRVITKTPERGSPPNEVHPERGSSRPPNEVHPEPGSPPNEVPETPERGSPGTVLEPSVKNSPSGSSTRTRTRDTPARGTRIPADFSLTDDMCTYAERFAAEALGREPNGRFGTWLDRKTLDFIDYWNEKSGSQAVKRDWLRAWQRWMRREIEQSAEHPPRQPGTAVAIRDGPRPSTTDQRVGAALALAAQLEAEEAPV